VTRLPVMSMHTIPGQAEQVVRSREFVRVVLGEDHPAGETAVLLTSEIVTNSVLHSASARAGGTVTIAVVEIPGEAGDGTGLVRVEVTDDGAPNLPVMRTTSEADESGHGLHLVDALAAHWGCRRDDSGTTTTWFELTL
jgi:serine/threonine-protein kinase RsbW